ncbi:Flp family type IVb pilin [Halomonas pacifica]|uniref:Flp family type IVb pilin n=1 Tax=Bisbaumannia pacifica TaxID=77098 RepID=A0ABD4L436_9GAMM|nr:Flp family type IVb pilin [Halomonas pacifica]MBH8581504.1 Flp family type IVb pilin [Halomonas pacifica]MDC8805436.1 Flp family type IVb pilin [Halomonas pacifica]
MKKVIEKTTSLTQRGAVAMRINRAIFRKQQGASAIEYVVIAAVIALAVFVGSELGLAQAFSDFFTEVKTAIDVTPEGG